MRRRPPPPPPSSSSDGQTGSPSADVERSRGKIDAERSAVLCFTMFVLFLYGSWEVYRFHYHRLPAPLTASQAGKRGFSEELAMKHVKALTGFGPRPVGSDSLDRAVQIPISMVRVSSSLLMSMCRSLKMKAITCWKHQKTLREQLTGR